MLFCESQVNFTCTGKSQNAGESLHAGIAALPQMTQVLSLALSVRSERAGAEQLSGSVSTKKTELKPEVLTLRAPALARHTRIEAPSALHYTVLSYQQRRSR